VLADFVWSSQVFTLHTHVFTRLHTVVFTYRTSATHGVCSCLQYLLGSIFLKTFSILLRSTSILPRHCCHSSLQHSIFLQTHNQRTNKQTNKQRTNKLSIIIIMASQQSTVAASSTSSFSENNGMAMVGESGRVLSAKYLLKAGNKVRRVPPAAVSTMRFLAQHTTEFLTLFSIFFHSI
jgi:hypothetical protein